MVADDPQEPMTDSQRIQAGWSKFLGTIRSANDALNARGRPSPAQGDPDPEYAYKLDRDVDIHGSVPALDEVAAKVAAMLGEPTEPVRRLLDQWIAWELIDPGPWVEGIAAGGSWWPHPITRLELRGADNWNYSFVKEWGRKYHLIPEWMVAVAMAITRTWDEAEQILGPAYIREHLPEDWEILKRRGHGRVQPPLVAPWITVITPDDVLDEDFL